MDRPTVMGVKGPFTPPVGPTSGSPVPRSAGVHRETENSTFKAYLHQALATGNADNTSPQDTPATPLRRFSDQDFSILDNRWTDLIRIWTAERMAELPGSESPSPPSTGVSDWLWPVLLETLLENEQKDGLEAPAAQKLADSRQTAENRAATTSRGVGQWEPLIRETARRYALDPALLEAIMIAESAGNPEARSPAGALGLMQLMPATARALGVDPLNPVENLDGGARYLKSLIARFHGDTTKAVAAYNAGPTAVEKYGGVPPYRETQEYVRRVSELYSQFRNRSLG